MRALLGLVSLLLGLWLVMTLLKFQVGDGLPSTAAPGQPPSQAPQQVQRQYQDALNQALERGQRKPDALDGLER